MRHFYVMVCRVFLDKFVQKGCGWLLEYILIMRSYLSLKNALCTLQLSNKLLIGRLGLLLFGKLV